MTAETSGLLPKKDRKPCMSMILLSVRVPYLTFDIYDNIAIYYLQVLMLYWLPGHQQMLSSQSSESLWFPQGVASNYWCGSQ